MSDDAIDWITLELELTEDPAVLEMLDELNRRLASSDPLRFDPAAIEAIKAACTAIVEGFAATFASVVDAIAGLFDSLKPIVLDVAAIMAELDQAIEDSSRRAGRPRPTLSRRAIYAPPRDLRATEAPRRPPATYHRRR